MTLTKVMRAVALLPLLIVILISCGITKTQAQENIMPQIPPSLLECYNTSYFMNRQNRLPATIDTLISLIEKVENNNTNNYDMRTLSVALLHRFRQDGIQRAYGIAEAPGLIPYSPTGFQFPKFRILLSLLIPGNAINFPNNTLTREERCSIHFMLSSSIDVRVRGDENQVCQRLSQYRAERLRRSAHNADNDLMGDVEVLENLKVKQAEKRGLKQKDAYNANDYDWGWSNSGSGSGNNNNNNQISQCPVENGVVWTPWGSVSAGALIAGVATGLQQQSVQLRTLLALSSRKNGYTNMPQMATVKVDNRWAATLAGDLSEVALLQVPFTSTETASVGAIGAWNSTVMPEWYFLSQRQNLQMTDAEIRGGLDGLLIALNVASWRSQTTDLKLSQLLRMYYSTNGVLNSGINACNRKQNFNTYISSDQLVAQTSVFSQVLDREMQLGVTLSPANIATFSLSAASALENYVPNSLNDVTCSVSNSANGGGNQITPMTNIYVFLDTTWQYNNIVDYVNYILERLNVNPYASSVTLLAAYDGSIIVNTTNYMPDIYQGWNVTTQAQYTPGFNLPKVLKTLQNLTQSLMNAEQTNSSVSGRSLVALLIPYGSVTVSASDSTYSLTQLQYIYEQIPDLHFIYYTSGMINRFAGFVRNPSQDLFTLNTGNMVASSSGPVVARIVQTSISSYCYDDDAPQGIHNMTTVMTNIFVFLDTTWPYYFVVDYVNIVLQRLNINPYASSVTLLSASDGTIIVNATNYIIDVYEQWNATTHSWYTPGFSLPQILNTALDLARDIMNADRIHSSLGGKSMIALLVPSPIAFVSEWDMRYALHFLKHLNYTVPDLHFLYFGGGALIRFKDLVRNPHEDLFPLGDEYGVWTAGVPVVKRIREIPRRLVNPRCGADMYANSRGPSEMLQHVRSGAINFYRIMPNYFFGSTSLRYLRIQPVSASSFTVCSSRTITLPYRIDGEDQPEQGCGQTAATNSYSLDLSALCVGYTSIEQCPPLYVSVQAQKFSGSGEIQCSDPACLRPDDAQFTIYVSNLVCNGARRLEVTATGAMVSTLILSLIFM